MATISVSELEQLVFDALTASRVSDANARAVAAALTAADSAQLHSHGCARALAYAGQARSGKVNGQAVPQVNLISDACILVDALDGFAFPAIEIGLQTAADRVRSSGVQLVNIANSHHSGAIGLQMQVLAEQGLIGLAFSNAPAAIAPAGGHTPLFGTNPIAFVAPRESTTSLMIDMSLSHVARGKIMLAASRNEPIPEGWAVDLQGEPTTDAHKALAGSMLAIGESKGAALALMIELLCAALGGSNFGFEADSFFTADGEPPRVAQTFIVIDPERFAPGFIARAERLIQAINQQPGTRIPGERRSTLIEQAQKDGIDIDDDTLSKLKALSANPVI